MKREYHINFSKDSQLASEMHSFKLLLQLYRDLFGISTVFNLHTFESVFNQLPVSLTSLVNWVFLNWVPSAAVNVLHGKDWKSYYDITGPISIK